MRVKYEIGSHSNRMLVCGLDSSGSGWGPVAVSCEHYNELPGSI